MKNLSLLLGAAMAAIVASSCCILPLLLGAASAGTVGLGAAFAPYRPYLMALTFALLGGAFYFTYRPEKAACGPDGSCATEKTQGIKRLGKAVLWVVTLFTLGAMAYPSIASYRAGVKASLVTAPVAPETAETIVFSVGKMTCAECTLGITDALKKTPGVFDARVDYAQKRATVRYDSARVDVATLRTAIEGLGYSASEVAPPSST